MVNTDSDTVRHLRNGELVQIRADHERWLSSDGTEGSPARLARCRLAARDLRGANLERADLTEAYLEGVDLSGANLREARLRQAHLKGTSFRDADLTDADLNGAVGLLATQLAGADLTRAQLPESIRCFDGLQVADRIADNAQKLYIATLAGCAYSLLTIVTTTDSRLITNTASSPLPIIQTPVPIAAFFWIAPLVLTGMYFYFHLYLQRLWEALADLPAVFPDGVSFDRKVDPWLLTAFARLHTPRLSLPLRRWFFQHIVIVASAWWVTPAILLLFWGRYLRRHEAAGTFLQAVLVAIAAGGAVSLYGLAKSTIRRTGRDPFRWPPWGFMLTTWGVELALMAVSFSALLAPPMPQSSKYPFYLNQPGTWVPFVFARVLGYSVFAELTDAEMSVRSPGWADNSEQRAAVIGADLFGADLRGARADGAFLVNANLTGAELAGAQLREAQLQSASLRGADLRGAVLLRALLDEADLSGAHLQNVSLWRARLVGARLQSANLQNADLTGAELGDAILTRAHLRGAKLRDARGEWANFRGAFLQEADLREAVLRNADLREARLDGANLAHADLSGADMRGAVLGDAVLEGVNLAGADLRGAQCLTLDQLRSVKTSKGAKRTESLPTPCPSRE